MDKTVIPGAVEGEIEPPSSKSYAQRAIAAALLSEGRSVLSGIEGCDDTAAALRVIQALGAKVERTAPGTYAITGGRGADGGLRGATGAGGVLDIGESGLSTRLFTPIASLCASPVTIAGHGTILRRPMDMMIAPLRELGVEVKDSGGFLPLTVRGPMRGGEVEIDGSVSSQFLTGLLVALPLAAGDTTVRVWGLRSIPYIDMTMDVMERFGVDVDHRDYEEFYIPGAQEYTPASFTVEGDWSAASCLLVAGATSGGHGPGGGPGSGPGVRVNNLNPVSLQADVAIIEALSRAGAYMEQSAGSVTVSHRELRAFEFDATDCPDLFPALAALAASCEGTSVIVGTSRLTHKESDRAEAIRTEYGKLGIGVDISQPDVMRITGGPVTGGIVVDSHRDHRMAMSLAVAALSASAPVTIRDAECVSKSYADFWEDFDKLKI
jgi:3-phosphoshikimate 1-carboxyvinyltransferase